MDWIGFTVAILPVALSPGASFTMAMNNVARNGFLGAAPVIAGTATGIYVHATLAGLGVSRILSQSSTAMSALKFGGTAYLIWLALRMIKSGFSGVSGAPDNVEPVSALNATAANLLNVKPIILYLTIVPLFAGVDLSSYFLAASIHISVMAAFLFVCAASLATATKSVESHSVIAALNVVAGSFLLLVSIRALL